MTPLSPDASNASQIQQYLLSQDGLLSFYENATQYDYILENGVIYCSINSNGTFNNCTPTTAPTHGVNHPHGIAFNTDGNGAQHAYITDAATGMVVCPMNTIGSIKTPDIPTNRHTWQPSGIAFI